jgi:glutamine amidotransferase
MITNPRFSFKEIRTRSSDNPDGWGIGFYEDSKSKIFKESKPAFESDLAKKIEDGDIEVRSKIIIAHIRDASVGSRTIKNTHPFQNQLFDRQWIFAHNGTVGRRNPPTGIFLENTGVFKPVGETDSERAFCYMLNQISNKCDEKSQASEISTMIMEYADYIKKFGKFNFIMSDSKYLYCYGDTSLWFVERRFGTQEITLEDSDYRIRVSDMKRVGEKAIIVAIKPLTRNERWVRIDGLKIFNDGNETLNRSNQD